MGAHLSRGWGSQKKKTAAADSTNPAPNSSPKVTPKVTPKVPPKVIPKAPPKVKPEKEKKKRTLQRHHTVAELSVTHGSGAPLPTLFRHASYGDFRQHFQDDLRSFSKRFTSKLTRTESMPREDREVVKFKTDFQTKYHCNMSSPLSHGRYATVTAADCCLTSKKVAVKIIRKDKLFDRRSGKRCAGENVRAEVIALRNLTNQPHVVKFLDVFEDEAFFYVVMELCKGGNLLERINSCGPMKEEQAGPLLRQMVIVTRICHSHGIAHRDLKLENFVFVSDKEDYPLNLVDFGSAGFFKSEGSRPFNGPVGTFNYMAPEVYGSYYGPSADLWSLGIIGFALLSGSLPYMASSTDELGEKIKNDDVSFELPVWEQISESAKDLLKKLLNKNPDFRISTGEALSHPWLRQWDL